MIGKYLYTLARRQPVVVISHTPQVAAFADHLWQLEKSMHAVAETSITKLHKAQHAVGLSRILEGGVTKSSALAHAQSLIDHAIAIAKALQDAEQEVL